MFLVGELIKWMSGMAQGIAAWISNEQAVLDI